MIKIQAGPFIHTIEPTIFPDGTSQVWKLPKQIMMAWEVHVTWSFEAEREIIDILSLRKLLPPCKFHLHIPYMPYARQDKEVSNDSTFNLAVIADLINSLQADSVTSIDVHNAYETRSLINDFTNISPRLFHDAIISKSAPHCLVFPDYGAVARYKAYMEDITLIGKMVCAKTRDQLTGTITGHSVSFIMDNPTLSNKFLIVDDICDGGATFISVAKMLRETNPMAQIDLCVTHGLFSKGRQVLHEGGIDNVYTTNSLIKNGDGFNV